MTHMYNITGTTTNDLMQNIGNWLEQRGRGNFKPSSVYTLRTTTQGLSVTLSFGRRCPGRVYIGAVPYGGSKIYVVIKQTNTKDGFRYYIPKDNMSAALARWDKFVQEEAEYERRRLQSDTQEAARKERRASKRAQYRADNADAIANIKAQGAAGNLVQDYDTGDISGIEITLTATAEELDAVATCLRLLRAGK